MNYSDYTVEEFVADPLFKQWVLAPESTTTAFWESWLIENPEKKALVEEARQMVLLLKFEAASYSQKEADSLLRRIDSTLEQKTYPELGAKEKTSSLNRSWFKIAAAFTLLITASLFWYYFYQRPVMQNYATEYGKKMVVMLPDSSSVVLNANSQLSFRDKWNQEETREVYLEGEAFFEVTKKPAVGKRKFVVHTQNLDVEVLGTQFNVNDRESTTTVTLNEGVIQLQSEIITGIQNIKMVPGEQAQVSKNKKLKIKQVNTDLYTSWKDNKLIFENTPIEEITRNIAQTYGLKINIQDSSIYNRKFTGTLPANNINIILKTFAEMYHLDISKKGDEILLRQK